jgi:16S rRNA (guanine966-N2)-methyltransferase
VRLIGGQWKRSLLPVADRPGLRPTPNRVRQTLFDWLGFLAPQRHADGLAGWRCVDAFAGTGALGLEAASRGAASVLLVESDAVLAASLEATGRRLAAATVRVQRGDGIAVLRSAARRSVDLVFLDPPFGSRQFEAALAAARQAVSDAGCVYLEADREFTDADLGPLGFERLRHLRAGAVHAHLLGVARSAAADGGTTLAPPS